MITFDGVVVVYKAIGDLYFYVSGDQEENELIVLTVLQAFYEAVTMLLRCASKICCQNDASAVWVGLRRELMNWGAQRGAGQSRRASGRAREFFEEGKTDTTAVAFCSILPIV